MRIVLGFLSGVLGMLAGWFGLAFLIVALAGRDPDGGTAMGAFFNIGPLGAVIGFGAGIWLFVKFGLVAQGGAQGGAQAGAQAGTFATAPPSGPASPSPLAATVVPATTRISRSFAALVLAIVGALAWWGWYEFLRAPYLTHGYMTLALQFRLPADVAPPPDAKDVQVVLEEGGQRWPAYLNEEGWRGHQGDRVVILATVSMESKTSRRIISLSMPGVPTQSWTLDLSSDPDPTAGYTAWRPSKDAPDPIELNYRLTADR